jgi:hypothetical protein
MTDGYYHSSKGKREKRDRITLDRCVKLLGSTIDIMNESPVGSSVDIINGKFVSSNNRDYWPVSSHD